MASAPFSMFPGIGPSTNHTRGPEELALVGRSIVLSTIFWSVTSSVTLLNLKGLPP
jgi:hypothetical protein